MEKRSTSFLGTFLNSLRSLGWKIKIILFFTLLASSTSLFALSQSYERDLGDMFVSFKVGTYFPLFLQNPNGAYEKLPIGTPVSSSSEKQIPIGGLIDFNYMLYLDPHWQVGLDTLFSISTDINGNAIFMVPLSFRTAYEFRFYHFNIPLFLDTGMNFIIYNDHFVYTPFLRPGFSFDWSYNPQWSFGLSMSYWWVPQILPANHYQNTVFANFLDLTLSLTYNF